MIQRGGLICREVADVDERKSRAIRSRQVALSKRCYRRGVGLVEPLIPPGKRGGGKRRVSLREVVNGLMYVL